MIKIILQGSKAISSVMVSSSSLSMCALHSTFTSRVPKCSKEFMDGNSSLYLRQPLESKLSPLSSDLKRSRFFANEKPLRWEQTAKLPPRNRVLSHALDFGNTPFSVGNKFQLDDVIEAQQFDRETLSAIFEVAREMEKVEKNSPGSQILKGYLMATLFYEPSTRTRLSFESAMKRLGGEVLTTENAREFSSAAKGETLEGTFHLLLGFTWW